MSAATTTAAGTAVPPPAAGPPGRGVVRLVAALFLLAGLGGVLWLMTRDRDRAAAPTTAASLPSGEGIGAAIDGATGYLTGACDENGRFRYRVDTRSGRLRADPYNIVRHAGAVLALDACDRRRSSPDTRAAIVRSVGYLRRETLRPVPGEEGLLAVWSGRTGSRIDPPHAKLGGAGLGLIALLAAERVAPGSIPREEPRALARFIVRLQKPGGRFYARYTPAAGGPTDTREQLFYEGEALLGLAWLHETDPDPAWRHAALRGLLGMGAGETGGGGILPDHWVLLATSRWLAVCGDDPEWRANRPALLDHARKVAAGLLGPAATAPGGTPATGTPSAGPFTCPVATRMEGLLALYPLLGAAADEPLRQRIAENAATGAAFLVGAQIRDGALAGGFPAVQTTCAPNPRDFRNRFLLSQVHDLRIDYVQHAVCGLIQYEALSAQP